MLTIRVCPLSKVEDQVSRHRPRRVVSMLDPERNFPELGDDYADRHLRLSFHDIDVPAPNCIVPSAEHIQTFLGFVSERKPADSILIHCRAGISRSTAAAFVLACFAKPEVDELEIVHALRRASPLARPNSTLVALADQEMDRGGRMTLAIATTGRDLPWIDVDENEPFPLSLADL